MKVILGILAMAVTGMFVLLLAVGLVFVQLLPLLAVAALIVVVGRVMMPTSPGPTNDRRPAPRAEWSARPPTAHRGVRSTPPHGQWVYLPVWVEANRRPVPTYIDAEVIEEERSG